jgi:hypothetical protein
LENFVNEIFNQINNICENYAGYKVTPSEKIEIPLILGKYIQEKHCLGGNGFVKYLCQELGYGKYETDELKKIKLWKDLCSIGEKMDRHISIKGI